jgi:NodT family efflux transporter outer membrane factor (OMF) lipoprotein
MTMKLRRLALPSLLALAGCTVGPDYVPPAADAPSSWSEAGAGSPVSIGPGDDEKLAGWWHGFADPGLDLVVEAAIAENLDLKMAEQRVLEARAERDAAAAGLYPSVTLGGFGGRAGINYPPISSTSNFFAATFESSWELDLFGKTRRTVEAAEATADAAVEDRRAVLVSLLAELGQDYAGLRSAEARIAIARRNIEAQKDAAGIAREKFHGGLGSELDVAQADAELTSLQAVVPQLEAAAAEERHAIAVLLGKPPESPGPALAETGAMPIVPPALPAALPSEVVRNRPDIREAERRYASANAQIGVAVANEFPSFSIAPDLVLASGSIGKLFTSGAVQWILEGSASQPLFDGGKREANVRGAKATAEEARLAYRKTVLTAFQEVEDALVAYRSERQRHESLAAAVAADRVAVARATSLYRAGLGEFLNVLDSERSLYAAEDALAVSDLTLVQQAVALYKALGAGWQAGEKMPAQAVAADPPVLKEKREWMK